MFLNPKSKSDLLFKSNEEGSRNLPFLQVLQFNFDAGVREANFEETDSSS